MLFKFHILNIIIIKCRMDIPIFPIEYFKHQY